MMRTILSALFVFYVVFNTHAQTQVIGSVDGVFNVSDLGAASYSIPIKIPGGLGGVQPAISLEYNSQNGNGPLGVGWSISGLSAIARAPNTIYHDNVVKGVELGFGDKFSLDGNRLIVKSGTYGASGSTYGTEMESFRDITANGVLGAGPESFTVRDQDGKTYQYGGTADARVIANGKTEPHMWLLNKVTDLLGNYVSFEYSNVNGEVLPNRIYYNGNQATGLAYRSYIAFFYSAKSDPNYIYSAGGQIPSTKKLTQISVVQREGTVWKYFRSYIPEYADDFFTHLVRIKEQGNGNLEVLPVTEFTYGSTGQTIATAHAELRSTEVGNLFAQGDYNGDGRTDLLRFSGENANNNFSLYLSNGTPNSFVLNQTGMLNSDPAFNNLKNTILPPNQAKSVAFDYNGDGKDDFAYIQQQENSACKCAAAKQKFYIYLSSGLSLTPLDRPVVSSGTPGVSDQFGNLWPLFGDFDGDGKSEILAVFAHPTGSSNLSYLIGEQYNVAATTTGPANAPTPYPVYVAKELYGLPFNGKNNAKLFVIDYNADGKSDILYISGGSAYVYEMNVSFDANKKPVIGTPAFRLVNSSGYPSQWHDVFVGDFNGDKITDVLTYYPDGGVGWEVGYGKGNGLMDDIKKAPVMAKPYGGFYNDLRPIIIADFNGDGMDDIYDYSASTTWGQAYAPRLFCAKGYNTFVSEPTSFDASVTGDGFVGYWIGDYNGDGSSDFLSRSFYHTTPYVLAFHVQEARHQISKIQDGLGAVTKLSYTSFPSVYNAGGAYSYPYVRKGVPLKVVNSVNKDNGINTLGNNVFYTYYGLHYNVHGKGIMGFDKVISNDEVNSVFVEKQFDQNETFAIPFLKRTLIKQGTNSANATFQREETNFYDVYNYGNKRVFFYKTQTSLANYIDNTTQSEVSEYSLPGTSPALGEVNSTTIGKPLRVTVNKGNGLELESRTFTYSPSITNVGGLILSVPSYVYSRPQTVLTELTRLGQPAYTRKQQLTYNNTNGLLLTSVADPNTPAALSSSFSYDNLGNVTQSVLSTSGFNPQTEINSYDPSGRFVIKSYNADFPAVQNTAVYSELAGKVLTGTEPDGLVKTYSYDGFGRDKSVSDNNGKQVNIVYGWASASPYTIAGATYYMEEAPNTAAATLKFFDRLNRLVRTVTKGFDGTVIYEDIIYNAKGQIASSTRPYFANTAPLVSSFVYDAQGRPLQETRPDGNIAYAYAISGNDYIVSITDAAGQVKKRYLDKAARLTRVIDNGGVLDYVYHSNGNVKSVSLDNIMTSETEYDGYGRQKKMTDPNSGSFEYTYNAFGQLVKQKDPQGNVYDMAYNTLGAMISKTGSEGTYNYTYNAVAGSNCGKMTQMTGPGAVHNYSYGTGDKVNYQEAVTGGQTFKTEFTYDAKGRLNTQKYPNGKVVNFIYNANDGGLSGIGYTAPGAGWLSQHYLVSQKNVFGQVTSYEQEFKMDQFGDPYSVIHSDIGYSPLGLLNSQYTFYRSTVIPVTAKRNFTYNFQVTTGNLLQRKDLKYGLQEDFTYDNLNRLTIAQGQKLPPSAMMFVTHQTDYLSNGNIAMKSDAGTYGYSQANRLSEIDPYVNIPSASQTVTYTPFDKIASVEEGTNKLTFAYWADQSRSKMERYTGNVLTSTTYYAPGFEKTVDAATGSVRELCYVSGAEGDIVSILERKNGVDKTYLVLTDHLGSITQILDDNGNIVEEKSFDSWGRSRNPASWSINAPTMASNGWDRGYTAHEHLPEFGIINMNGRLYDPLLGRMFSPDPYVMGAESSQGYNRYTYALNNPLSYNDPSGKIAAPVVVGLIVGAYMGGSLANKSFDPFEWDYTSVTTWGYMMGGAVAGGASGGVGGYISTLSTPFANTLAIGASSLLNSIGTYMYSNGQSDISLSLGAGSYNFSTGELGYLGKKGNSLMQNVGYTFGALANIQDGFAGLNGIKGTYRAEGGGVPHARLKGSYLKADDIDISVAHEAVPSNVYKNSSGGLMETLDYARYWSTHIKKGLYYSKVVKGPELEIPNVNGKWLSAMTDRLGDGINQGKGMWGIGKLRYGTSLFGCQSHVAHALWGVGVPTLPVNIHPLVLYGQLWLRQMGIYAAPYLTNQ